MVKPNNKAAWGNRFGFLNVGIPIKKLDNTLAILRNVKENLDRKKMSLTIFIMDKALGYVTKVKGPQVHEYINYYYIIVCICGRDYRRKHKT